MHRYWENILNLTKLNCIGKPYWVRWSTAEFWRNHSKSRIPLSRSPSSFYASSGLNANGEVIVAAVFRQYFVAAGCCQCYYYSWPCEPINSLRCALWLWGWVHSWSWTVTERKVARARGCFIMLNGFTRINDSMLNMCIDYSPAKEKD